MPIDPNIFFAGQQAQQRQAAIDSQNAGRIFEILAAKRQMDLEETKVNKALEAEANDPKNAYMRVLTNQAAGIPSSPEDMARAKAYGDFRASEVGMNFAGDIYSKFNNQLAGGQTQAAAPIRADILESILPPPSPSASPAPSSSSRAPQTPEEQAAADEAVLDMFGFNPSGDGLLAIDGMATAEADTLPPVPMPTEAPKSNKSPRFQYEISLEQGKKDVEALDQIRTKADAASSVSSIVSEMVRLQPQLGYTGFGGEALGMADNAIEGFNRLFGTKFSGLDGAGAAREEFKAKVNEAWLSNVQKMKGTGALTEPEGKRLEQLTPSLNTSPEGMQLRAKTLEEAAIRVQMHRDYMENYFNQFGTLSGAQQQWNAWAKENPLTVLSEFGKGKGVTEPKQAPKSGERTGGLSKGADGVYRFQ